MLSDTGIAGAESLGADINKPKGQPTPENKTGVVSQKLPELTLEMNSEDIVKLTDKWEKDWKESDKKDKWEKQIEDNEKYWLGNQIEKLKADNTRAEVDNLIFESLETYLPLATRRNPEPLVSLDSSEKGDDGNEDPIKTKFVAKVKGRLTDLADKNKVRLKLKKGARHHSIYQLGVAKFGWDLDRDLPVVRIIRPKRMILDPDATIDEDGYTGDRIGEYRKLTATKILGIIGTQEDVLDPETGKVATKGNSEAVAKVKEMVKDDNMATVIQFIEWWTPEYTCWKLDKTIIYKKKNPHWNYNRTETPAPTDMASPGVQVDDYGNQTEAPVDIEGINHFAVPKMPYEFLSVYNLGDQPMDKTSLIGQNLSNQDLLNKRNKQITKNVDDMNGGMVVSLARSGLTEAQAAGVTRALRKGGVVSIPDGAPREAIDRYPAPGLPADVFNQLADTRERLRDIFGVRGSSAAGLDTEQTVRGKILNKSSDGDRIGGGLTEYLEQWADDWYNWFVQLMYVYDPAFQFVPGATPPKIIISVKEGSLLPKDSTSIANQALELANINRISNIDLYKRLEWPNPEELAANVWLELNAPQLLYKNNPLVQEAIQMQQQAAQQAAEQQAQQEMAKTQVDTHNAIKKDIVKSELNIREAKAMPQKPTPK